MGDFRTFDNIEVRLVGFIPSSYELAVASARTCYSGSGVILPSQVSQGERGERARDRIASSTLGAGHLTTRQHASFVFALSGVSRQFIWNFLHSHPYYNSEQVSQRYVRVKPNNFLIPPLPGAVHGLFRDCVVEQIGAYEKLIELLRPAITGEYFQRFVSRKKDPARWAPAIDKRVYEVARYVLGIGTSAHLYHTVSALTLLRYARMCELFETPAEQKVVVGKMLDCVRAVDPLFDKDIVSGQPLESTLEYQLFHGSRPAQCTQSFVDQFDQSLEGRHS